jgi:hypothetical protein
MRRPDASPAAVLGVAIVTAAEQAAAQAQAAAPAQAAQAVQEVA